MFPINLLMGSLVAQVLWPGVKRAVLCSMDKAVKVTWKTHPDTLVHPQLVTV